MSSASLTYPAPNPRTISDIEQTIETALENLRPAPLSGDITAAFPFLLPSGLKIRVQLEEDGRKKRSTAAASNWTPETGEIVIYFERPESTTPADNATSASQTTSPVPTSYDKFKGQIKSGVIQDPVSLTREARHEQTSLGIQSDLEQDISDNEIEQLCAALADAEKAGKSFIAFKWFRDNDLASRGYEWALSLPRRQAVITKAIEVGAVITSSIPNPRAPQYPTTTVKLNTQSKYAQTIPPRFSPVRTKDGASASEILLRDRGRP